MRLDHVGLAVADLPTMTDWYCGALALDVEFSFEVDGPDLGGRMLRSTPTPTPTPTSTAAPWRLELLHRPGSVAGPQPASPLEAALTRGFGHLALAVPDVDAAYDALLAAGATARMSPRPSPEPGVRMAYVADPEGNLLELLDRSPPDAPGRPEDAVLPPSDASSSTRGT